MSANKKQVKIESIFENDSNPRYINKKQFEKLVKSIRSFPQMLEKRPIIIDEHNVILGGNMRLKACKEAGLKKVWVDQVTDWTEKQKREFIIKDNVGFGEWDWDILGNDYSFEELAEWGLTVTTGNEDIEDLSENLIADLKIEISVKSEEEQEELFNELSKRGFKCRVLTL